MLTACSSDNDVVQSATPSQQQTLVNRAVGFDIYTPSATTTRAGLEGTMTTNRMQLSEGEGGGFGVYAYLTEDDDATAGEANAKAYSGGVPNFMVNEKVLWNSTNLGWYYSPLKYWPNETDHDSQNTNATMEGSDTHLDRLTFFAYAPYVPGDAGSTGIIHITDKTGKLNSTSVTNPTIEWTASENPTTDFNPNQGVDLLWGVAPAGGLSYTAVNGWTVTRNEGTPLLNMIKPDVNTNMKFLFQHALARIGINVVAAVDQVSPGGELDPNTKITIESLKITGPFGTTGKLDLDNGTKASVANWTTIGGTTVNGATSVSATNGTILVAANATNNAIAQHLRWEKHATPAQVHITPVQQTHVGVTTAKQDLLAPSTKWFNKLASAPTYNPGKEYYTDAAGTTPATATVANGTKIKKDGKWGFLYTELSGKYTKQDDAVDATAYPAAASNLYFVKVVKSYTINTSDATTFPPASTNIYTGDYATKDGTTAENAPSFVYSMTTDADPDASELTSLNGQTVYTLEAVNLLNAEVPYTYSGSPFYEAERNYLYVVPTNAALDTNFGGVTPSNEATLRTITLQIEYYISTEDSKLSAGRTETKNVVTKTVVLPSLSNGKSYMLNLVLGLTSVKVEAEVDDWKVINSQADLPQNTAE